MDSCFQTLLNRAQRNHFKLDLRGLITCCSLLFFLLPIRPEFHNGGPSRGEAVADEKQSHFSPIHLFIDANASNPIGATRPEWRLSHRRRFHPTRRQSLCYCMLCTSYCLLCTTSTFTFYSLSLITGCSSFPGNAVHANSIRRCWNVQLA